MKKLFIIASIAATAVVLSSYGANFKPTFENNYVKVVAQGDLCGAFSIKPIKDVILIQSQLIKPGSAPRIISKAPTGDDWVFLYKPDKFKYDWASNDPQSHYRIYCSSVVDGKLVPVNCKDVVTIQSITHNALCDFIVEDYSSLNMNKA